MKTFRTVFPARPATFPIRHGDRLLLAGSCFTEHIGARLAAGKFRTLLNPHGIAYNPVSIARCLTALLAPEPAEWPLFRHQGLWHSWEHHGAFSHPEAEAAQAGIRQAREAARTFLAEANRLLLTFGTADVFVLQETGEVVANCHKAPAAWFTRRRLSVGETTAVLADALYQLKTRLPGLRVVLTVSPVRHLRAGFVDNQRSKAVLVLACAELCARFDFVEYFPAYELLLDDLRDYRFYAADMIHPNEVAIDYIWEQFAAAFFPPETRRLLEQIGKIRSAASHRPFNADTAEHRAFARTQVEKIEALLGEEPGLDFGEELAKFRKFI